MRIFATRELPGQSFINLREQHDVTVWSGAAPPTRHELERHVSAADALITMLSDRVDQELLLACPELIAIGNYAVGFENIDVTAATRRGVAVGNTPSVLTDSTSQLTITLILDLLRRVQESDRSVRAGKWLAWEPQGFLGRDLESTCVGIVGYGRIGQKVAALARALGMETIHTGHDGLSIDEVIERADVLSLHVPLTESTRHLIDAKRFAAMKRGAYLVNTSRGPVIDTAALVSALRSGHLGGAALDVTDPEPLPADHELLHNDNVIVTPHIASATTQTRTAMTDATIANVVAALDGQMMPSCVNPEVYQRHSAQTNG